MRNIVKSRSRATAILSFLFLIANLLLGVPTHSQVDPRGSQSEARETRSLEWDIPPEIQRLVERDALTVRALRAWGLLPDHLDTLALNLKTQGIDVFAARERDMVAIVADAGHPSSLLHPHLSQLNELLNILLAYQSPGRSSFEDQDDRSAVKIAAPEVESNRLIPSSPYDSKTLIQLPDSTSFRILGLHEESSISLSIELAHSPIQPPQQELQTIGAGRVVTITDAVLSGGSLEFHALSGVISMPAHQVSRHEIETINMLRIGPVLNGETIEHNAVRYLPVSIDEQGNVSAMDPFLSDAVLLHKLGASPIAYHDGIDFQEYPSNPLKRIYLTLGLKINFIMDRISPVRLAQAREAGLNKAATEITYIPITFEKTINWARRPVLIRMAPSKEFANLRKPIDEISSDDRDTELKKPIQNVFVLVHGRNENEKDGTVATDIDEPWLYSYKRNVWTPFYEILQRDHEEHMSATAIFEFIYPSFRPIFTPVAGEGNRATLDQDFYQSLKEALKPQLENNLDFNLFIISHSMGGLVARSGAQYFDDQMESMLDRLVTWGTPHRGSPLVSLRYLLAKIGKEYRKIGDPSLIVRRGNAPSYAHELAWYAMYYATRQSVESFTIDTPGTRDLRWDLGPDNRPMRLTFSFYFAPIYDFSKLAKYHLGEGHYLFNYNLAELNRNDRFSHSDKYLFMYGLTDKTVFEPWGTRVFGDLIPAPAVDLSEIAKGATTMRTLLRNPDDLIFGSPAWKSDGAAPVASLSGYGLGAKHIYLSNIDHEEYFGTPQGSDDFPGVFTQLGKARETATRTLGAIEFDDESRYGPPHIEFKALSDQANDIVLYLHEPIELSGRLIWPGDENPGRRVNEPAIAITLSGEPTEAEIELHEDGSLTIRLDPNDIKHDERNQRFTHDFELTIVFKDDTELTFTQEAIRFLKPGVMIYPVWLVAEAGAEINLSALPSENFVYVWDFGDGTVKTETNHSLISHTYHVVGDHHVALTLYDLQGRAMATDSIVVQVVEPELIEEEALQEINDICTPEQLVALGHYQTLTNTVPGGRNIEDSAMTYRIDSVRNPQATVNRIGETFYSGEVSTGDTISLSAACKAGDLIVSGNQFNSFTSAGLLARISVLPLDRINFHQTDGPYAERIQEVELNQGGQGSASVTLTVPERTREVHGRVICGTNWHNFNGGFGASIGIGFKFRVVDQPQPCAPFKPSSQRAELPSQFSAQQDVAHDALTDAPLAENDLPSDNDVTPAEAVPDDSQDLDPLPERRPPAVPRQSSLDLNFPRVLVGNETNTAYYGFTGGSINLPHLDGGILQLLFWNDQHVSTPSTSNQLHVAVGGTTHVIEQYTTLLDVTEEYTAAPGWGPAGGSKVRMLVPPGIGNVSFSNQGSATGFGLSDITFSTAAPEGPELDLVQHVNRTQAVVPVFNRKLHGARSGTEFFGYQSGSIVLPNQKGGRLHLRLWNDHHAARPTISNRVMLVVDGVEHVFAQTTTLEDMAEFYREFSDWGPAGGKNIVVPIPSGTTRILVNSLGGDSGFELSDIKFESFD